jgi:hypothetical protein
MPAALDKSLGATSDNVASATQTLTTTAAAVAGAKILLAAGAAGVAASSCAGGGLTWTLQGSSTSGGYTTSIFSADAPAGLASGTVLTVTYPSSVTHGLISAGSFTGLATGTATLAVVPIGNSTGIATAGWGPIQAVSANDEGALLYAVSLVDNSGTSTPTGDATELHDLSNVSFFGAMTTQYQVLGPNQLGRAAGTWSNVSGSVTNNTLGVLFKDSAGVVTTPPRAIADSAPMAKVR